MHVSVLPEVVRLLLRPRVTTVLSVSARLLVRCLPATVVRSRVFRPRVLLNSLACAALTSGSCSVANHVVPAARTDEAAFGADKGCVSDQPSVRTDDAAFFDSVAQSLSSVDDSSKVSFVAKALENATANTAAANPPPCGA